MKRILRLPEVIKQTGLSRSTIYAFMKKGNFVESVNLSDSGRAIGWDSELVQRWIDSRLDSKLQNKEESC
ncbi:AlpA family phage regulatory protein [Rickettsiales bacterium]|nr:AlpA family phage regulatory protein [Rickettsiales bacterium]